MVSVIIPAYNASRTIEHAVSCVVTQSYADIEIIIINDGSTDNTLEICNRIAEIDSRVKVICQPQSGPGMARNTGLDVAQGKYVYFMDADDTIDKDLIIRCVNLMDQNELDLLMFGFALVDDNRDIIETIEFDPTRVVNKDELRKAYIPCFLKPKHGNGFLFNKFYRSSIIEQHAIRFTRYNIMEDELFNIEYCQHVERLQVIEDVLYFYYWTSIGSIRARHNPTYLETLRTVHLSFMDLKDKLSICNNEFDNILNHRTWNGLFGYLSYKLINSFPKLTKVQIKEKFLELASDQVFRSVSCYQYEKGALRIIEMPFYYSIKKNDFRLYLIVSCVYNALMPLRRLKRYFSR